MIDKLNNQLKTTTEKMHNQVLALTLIHGYVAILLIAMNGFNRYVLYDLA